VLKLNQTGMEIRVCTLAGKKKDRKEVIASTPAEPEIDESGQKEVPGEQAQILEQLQNQNIALQNELRNNQIQFKQLALSQQHAPEPAPDTSKLDEPIKLTRRGLLDFANDFIQFTKSTGLFNQQNQMNQDDQVNLALGRQVHGKVLDKMLNVLFDKSQLKDMKNDIEKTSGVA